MRTRWPPPGRRWMNAVTTGTRARSARSAAPGGVCAGRPKNGTKTPAPCVSWSIRRATMRPRRSASRAPCQKCGSSRSRISRPAPDRNPAIRWWKRSSWTRRATTVSGYPRCATAAARSSQLPTCAAMARHPLPAPTAASSAAAPSMITYSGRSASRRQSASSANDAPAWQNVDRARRRRAAGDSSGKATPRCSTARRRGRPSTAYARLPSARPRARPTPSGSAPIRWPTPPKPRASSALRGSRVARRSRRHTERRAIRSATQDSPRAKRAAERSERGVRTRRA